jgi:hypothetical protein
VTADAPDFAPLSDFVVKLPAIKLSDTPSLGIGCGMDSGIWWVKFGIDIDHPLAWRVVQELGHVLNLLSLEEPLPTSFKPVSPPPYMNGGPEDYLSWVIECPTGVMSPAIVAQWLEGRLPRPVDDPAEWELD